MSATPPGKTGEYCEECGRVAAPECKVHSFESFSMKSAEPIAYQRLFFCRECADEFDLYCLGHDSPMVVGRKRERNTARVRYYGACPGCLEPVMQCMPLHRRKEYLGFMFAYDLFDDFFSIGQGILPAEAVMLDSPGAPLPLNGAVFGLVLTAVLQGVTPTDLCRAHRARYPSKRAR